MSYNFARPFCYFKFEAILVDHFVTSNLRPFWTIGKFFLFAFIKQLQTTAMYSVDWTQTHSIINELMDSNQQTVY